MTVNAYSLKIRESGSNALQVIVVVSSSFEDGFVIGVVVHGGLGFLGHDGQSGRRHRRRVRLLVLKATIFFELAFVSLDKIKIINFTNG